MSTETTGSTRPRGKHALRAALVKILEDIAEHEPPSVAGNIEAMLSTADGRDMFRAMLVRVARMAARQRRARQATAARLLAEGKPDRARKALRLRPPSNGESHPKSKYGKWILTPGKLRRKRATNGDSSTNATTTRARTPRNVIASRCTDESKDHADQDRMVDAIVERIVSAARRRIAELVRNSLSSLGKPQQQEDDMSRTTLARAHARAHARTHAESHVSDSESYDSYREESVSVSLDTVPSEQEKVVETPTLFGHMPTVRAETPTRRAAAELVDEAVRIWNILAAHRGLRRAIKITPDRRKKLARALELVCECNIEVWTEACRKVARSAFLCGRNDRGWQATIDFMSRPTALARVLEGVFDNRPTHQTGHDGADVAAGALALLAARSRTAAGAPGQNTAATAPGVPVGARSALAATRVAATEIARPRASEAPWRRAAGE
jgi:hypothetical protein